MLSRMPPQAYIDQGWFERERELFFKPLWHFIGLKMMLSQHNAFITRTLCGLPIVVQNFNGELRAFENLCVHRQNPVQTLANGVRPLVCSYHGWGYGKDGTPDNIPFEAKAFRYSPEERACLHLRRFALEIIGNLVFINLSSHPTPISEQFGSDFITSLKECSDAFDGEVMLTTFKMQANWKLAYENLRDAHHPRYVHARSLYQKVKFEVNIDEAGLAAFKNLEESTANDRSTTMSRLRSFSNGGPDTPMKEVLPFSWHDNVERYGSKDWYYNWLAFPNLHIASGGGYSFIIEHHIPVSPDRTDMMVHYVTAKKKRRYAAAPAVLHAHMMGAERVLREDIDVMQNIQKQLYPGAPSARLGDYEFANGSIERWYLDVMEGKIAL